MTTHLNVRPTPAEAVARQRWMDEHWEELLAEYPEQFVAVLDGQVVAAGARVASVVQCLKGKGIDPRDAIVEFVSERVSSLLL